MVGKKKAAVTAPRSLPVYTEGGGVQRFAGYQEQVSQLPPPKIEQYVVYPGAHMHQPVRQPFYTKPPSQYMLYPTQLKAPPPNLKVPPPNNVQPPRMPAPPPNQKPVVQPSVQSQEATPPVVSTSGKAEITAASKGLIEVNSTNAARLIVAQPDIVSSSSPDLWHKVSVKRTIADKMNIINAINKRISPLMLIPYFFRMENGHVTFLVKNCSAALTTLCKRNLKVPYLSVEIELKLRLHSEKVDLNVLLKKIITKRLNSEKTFLNLSNLVSIPEFQKMMYDASDTSHIQQQLLRVAVPMAPGLVSLSLAGNEITTLAHLTGIFADKIQWKALKILDVSDNKIRNISELMAFNTANIKELYLHKNPVCGKYKEDHTYISVIRVSFPNLTKLDGTYLQQIPGVPHWRPNYFCSMKYGDSAELADQFLEHYFTLYDSDDRSSLRGLYHEKAYLSISCMYLPGQTTSHNARLSAYIADGRNLLRSTDKWKTKAALARGGPEKIIAKLAKLPRSQHDPYTFTVDLVHRSAVSTILTVTGVFKERNSGVKVSPRHFMRTFVLLKCANKEYQIVNDIVYVTNATSAESEDAFMYAKPLIKLQECKLPRRVVETEKNSVLETYSQLTGMNPDWSRKCLDTTRWDLREALEVFIEMYKANKIPQEGFQNS